MRVLITNNTLGMRAGSELYVRDLAIALLARGHSPVAYSTELGEVARELRVAAVPVTDDLRTLSARPDVIHGHHHLDTMTALTHFPGVPAVFFCHGWFPWVEEPPHFPRILRYVAVSEAHRDRLVCEHGIPEGRVEVLPNFVDLTRFRQRPPLPARPSRALLFNNGACEETYLPPVREACARAGLSLDVVGALAGNPAPEPERVLGEYDLVFATGRSALEALAVGTAVILCDGNGVGPMVTSENFADLRRDNFALRALRDPLTPDALVAQVAAYDAPSAAQVCANVRSIAGLDEAVERLLALYQRVREELAAGGGETDADLQASSAYLRRLAPRLKENEDLRRQLQGLPRAQAEISELRRKAEATERDLESSAGHRRSRTRRARAENRRPGGAASGRGRRSGDAARRGRAPCGGAARVRAVAHRPTAGPRLAQTGAGEYRPTAGARPGQVAPVESRHLAQRHHRRLSLPRLRPARSVLVAQREAEVGVGGHRSGAERGVDPEGSAQALPDPGVRLNPVGRVGHSVAEPSGVPGGVLGAGERLHANRNIE